MGGGWAHRAGARGCLNVEPNSTELLVRLREGVEWASAPAQSRVGAAAIADPASAIQPIANAIQTLLNDAT